MEMFFQSFSLTFRKIIQFIASDFAVSSRTARIARFALLAVTAGIAIGCALSPIAGYDWYNYYYKFAFDPLIDASPAWLYLLITPIAMLPHSFIWFTLLSGILLIASLSLIQNPHWLLVINVPVIWILFYGQIDGLVVFGAILGLWAVQKKQPILAGLAIILLCSKPHIGFPLALYYLFKARSLKALVIPLIVFLISLVVFGLWPVILIQRYFELPVAEFTTQKVNTSLWPWSLALIPLILLRWKSLGDTQKYVALTAATCLVIPYSPVYSLAPLLFLTSPTPLLSVLLLPAWIKPEWAAVTGSIFTLTCLLFYLFVKPAKEI